MCIEGLVLNAMFNCGVFRKGWKKDDSVLLTNTLMGPKSNALQCSRGNNGRQGLIRGCGLCSFISEVLSHHRTLPSPRFLAVLK